MTGEAIRSVLAQVGHDIAVYVADDASDDGSAAHLRDEFESEDPVTIVGATRSVGPAQTRERALDATRRPWVATLDSDDLWHLGKLDAQVAALVAGADVALCGHEWLDAAGKRVKASIPDMRSSGGVSPLLTDNMSTPLMRRRTVVAAGGFVAGGRAFSTCEHVDFHIRLSAVARYEVCREILVSCRAGAASRASDRMSTRLGARELLETIQGCMEILARHPSDLATLRMRAAARCAVAGRPRESIEQARLALALTSGATRRRLLRSYGPTIVRGVVDMRRK